MTINEIFIDGYKNLNNVSIKLDNRMNIFSGNNAQGKTNIIEAIWICSGCRSFRSSTSRDKNFIGFNVDSANIKMSFIDNTREQNISVTFFKSNTTKNNVKDKKVILNGVPLPLMSKLFGSLKCVVFTPEDLELSKGSPDNRRNFLDLSISQIKPSYFHVVNRYENLISQRNALLRDISNGLDNIDTLAVWDSQIAEIGSYISMIRFTYTNKLDAFTKKMYSKITRGQEDLTLSYRSSVFNELLGRSDYKSSMAEEYLAKLNKHISDDIRLGFTQFGVHRDDVITKINNLLSRDFGSQGQHRSIALVMKLSGAQILLEELNDSPIVLLDDILSELDPFRQNFILNEIDNMQLFITTCDVNTIHKAASVFLVDNGSVTPI